VPKFYITTPIYYVNDRPHIGHVYSTTIADIVARYHKLRGDDVFFLTGTDEHAAKVVDSAAAHGMTAAQWADQNAKAFQETFAKLGIANDDFIRTSEERHKVKVREYVSELLKSGDVYLGDYEGWYDAGQEEYVPENKAKEFEFKSPINGKPLVRKTEKNYFFRLSKYSGALLELLEKRPEFLQPDARRHEIANRIREGLNDVPISRTGGGDWGIRVPGDDAHIIYVWIDALFNYLSTVDTDARRKYWPADVHLIAKDILWFHAVIWPALLLALKRELPRQIYAHSFWISEGQKMSKSLGNFIDLEKIDRHVATYGLDALRYFLASNGPLGIADSDFSEAKFAEVYNADLANTLGNLINRSLSMIKRYRQGRVPAPEWANGGMGDGGTGVPPVDSENQKPKTQNPNPADPLDAELPKLWSTTHTTYTAAMNRLDLQTALAALWQFITRANQYVEQTAPWSLAKDPAKSARLDLVLYNLAESCRLISIAVTPFIPATAEKIQTQLGLSGIPHQRDTLQDAEQWGSLPAGTQLGELFALFPRKEKSS
jgi:methionyl-tRNA synthetase